MSKPNRAERIIAFLEARYPGWVPAVELEPVGGRQAWRTAVSEARAIVKGQGGDIENRVRQQWSRPSGQPWTLSEYRLVRHGASHHTNSIRASEPSGESGGQDLRADIEDAPHDCNVWNLR